MAYDYERGFARIEQELINSMMRNLKRHRAQELKEGLDWEQWQVLQLKKLNEYRRENLKKFKKEFQGVNASMSEAIKMARQSGYAEAEAEILEAIRDSKKLINYDRKGVYSSFFKLNDSKMDALLKAVNSDMQKAEYAVLRRANDRYRQIIMDAQLYANSGAGTYEQAVDMATKDFLSRGIDCVEYSNGARHTIKDYARMAIRTASKRAYLMGQADKRNEWGINTVIVNKRSNPCPKCLKYVGRVLIDDVYGSVPVDKNAKYPNFGGLLSEAIADGFLHPNCKDSYTTYFPDVTEVEEAPTEDDIEVMLDDYDIEQKKNIARDNYKRYQRLHDNALDATNRQNYANKMDSWFNAYSMLYGGKDAHTVTREDIKRGGIKNW